MNAQEGVLLEESALLASMLSCIALASSVLDAGSIRELIILFAGPFLIHVSAISGTHNSWYIVAHAKDSRQSFFLVISSGMLWSCNHEIIITWAGAKWFLSLFDALSGSAPTPRKYMLKVEP
jgi:hypothetical protein